jgi:tellurite resistance protein TehA-like permease
MTPRNDDRYSSSELARRRATSRDLVPGVIVLVVSQTSLIAGDPDASAGGWHLAWALSPLIGIGLLLWAQVRMLGRSDERERAIEFAAMAIAFGVVITALAALGVLQAAQIGDIRQLTQITTVLGIAAWVVASGLLKRRVS